MVVKCDIYGILSALGRPVGNVTSSVSVIATIEEALAGPLHRHAQRTVTAVPRVDHELGRLVHDAAVQTGADCVHSLRIAFLQARQEVGLSQEWRPAERHEQQVLADLRGREIHEESILGIYNVRFEAIARWTCDRDRQIHRLNVVRQEFDVKLLKGIHRGR